MIDRNLMNDWPEDTSCMHLCPSCDEIYYGPRNATECWRCVSNKDKK